MFAVAAVGILCGVSLLNLRQIRIVAAVTFAGALIGSFLVLFIGADLLGAKREIDFPSQPTFSRRYYVLADDDDKARRALPEAFLRTVGDLDRLVIEIDGSTLAAMELRPMSEDKSHLAPLAFAMRNAWGR